MIEIKVVGWEDGMELEACGHAAYAPRGADVVCAGVSALLFGYLAYLRSVTGEDGEMRGRVECAEGDGYLRICTRSMKGYDRAAWAVASAGVRLIADAYPAHVRLTEVGMEKSGGLPERESQKHKEGEGKIWKNRSA